jgi:spore coat polysaccharide biosynthesis protein SpsF
MKVLALLQARMGSTRLPGKVLLPILGKPMLQWQVERLRRSQRISTLVVATSVEPTDDPIAEFCAAHGVHCFRGSEHSVLDRFFHASLAFLSEPERPEAVLVRLTGDCPLTDAALIDKGIDQFLTVRDQGCRYLGYDSSLPDGMDFEVFTWDALREAHEHATDAFEKEHATPFMWRNPERFGVRVFKESGVPPGLRCSVDYPDDLLLVAAVLQAEQRRGTFFGMREVCELIAGDANLRRLTAHIVGNEGLIKTALASESFQATAGGVAVPKYGVSIPEGCRPSQEFLAWCARMGIRAWLAAEETVGDLVGRLVSLGDAVPIVWSPGARPDSWTVLSPQPGWERRALELSANPAVTGLLIDTSDREQLVQVLLFLCRDRFAVAGSGDNQR